MLSSLSILSLQATRSQTTVIAARNQLAEPLPCRIFHRDSLSRNALNQELPALTGESQETSFNSV
jgi:hypothetical protein